MLCFKRMGMRVLAVGMAVAMVACGARTPGQGTSAGGGATPAGAASPAPAGAIRPAKLVVNWFAEPEHGGQYAGLVAGIFKKYGMDMTIQQGGPQVSHQQIVASGNAQFGMGQADEILKAREQGIPLVALFAIFQTNPQALMFHNAHPVRQHQELAGRPIYVAPGAMYWQYIKSTYGLNDVRELAYTGSLAAFFSDPTAVTQIYATSEPFYARKDGFQVGYILNAESGYNPYANVLYTTEDLIRKDPGLVRSFVRASSEGWQYYFEHPDEVNAYIQKENPKMNPEAMKYSVETMKPLITGGDAKQRGIGYMSAERWRTLYDQMRKAGLLKKDQDLAKAYTLEFLMQK